MIIARTFISFTKNQLISNKLRYFYKPSRFHEMHAKMEKKFEATRKSELRYNFGLYALVFALSWAAVPFYKLFCEHFGLDGNLEQKDYSQLSKKKIDIHRKFTLCFESEIDPKTQWEFEPVQTDLQVNAGETALVFYRAFNKEENAVVGFSTYQIFPEDASLYFAKIQCFCFNQQLLNPKEELYLPIYFYLEPEILDDPLLKHVDNINIMYRFYKSRNQDLAKMAEEELKRVKKNKMILLKMRREKELGSLTDDDSINKIKNSEFTEEEIENFNEYDYEQENQNQLSTNISSKQK